MGSANMDAITFVLGPCEAIPLMSCGVIIKIVLRCDVSPPTIPTNLTTRMTPVKGGGQGPHFFPLVDRIGQQLTNTAAAGGQCTLSLSMNFGFWSSYSEAIVSYIVSI